ncbi:MAG: response regulator [Thermodesulfobacteriota bacterium]
MSEPQPDIHLLSVEDNYADFLLLREMLADESQPVYEMEHTPTLAAGLDRLQQGGVDVVLLDLGLPDSRGLDTFLRAKKEAGDLPIIVMTGADDLELALRAVQQGAQDYLVKGKISPSVLVRAIRYAIERAKLVQSLHEALDQLRTLKGLIPICASCKKIRQDDGLWVQLEAYFRRHAGVDFSHGICKECALELYPELMAARQAEGEKKGDPPAGHRRR